MYFDETIANASKYSDKVVEILKNQKYNYDLLKTMKFSNGLKKYISHNQLFLPANALIHGTSFDMEKLLKIKSEGILSSEFANNRPDLYNETFYMADFFKNCTGRKMSIDELLSCKTTDMLLQYLPGKQGGTNTSYLAFIVNTENKTIKDYLSLDLFTSNNTDLLEFIDEEFCYSLERRKAISHYSNKLGQSSIPLGVPYSALCGIIIDYKTENENIEELNFIKKVFGKDLFIISSSGRVLSKPKEQSLDF